MQRLQSNTNIRIPIKQFGDPPTPRTMRFMGGKGGYFQKWFSGGLDRDEILEWREEEQKGVETGKLKLPRREHGATIIQLDEELLELCD